jgi:hypothetical protein
VALFLPRENKREAKDMMDKANRNASPQVRLINQWLLKEVQTPVQRFCADIRRHSFVSQTVMVF